MPEPLPKVGVLLACLWQMHKLQIHKLVSRHNHLNVSTMYSIFEFELLSYRQAFLESTEISTSEEQNALEKAPVQFMALRILSRKAVVQFMALQILSGKAVVQFIPFQKLSRNIQFLVWFYMSSWSGTYSIENITLFNALYQQCQHR